MHGAPWWYRLCQAKVNNNHLSSSVTSFTIIRSSAISNKLETGCVAYVFCSAYIVFKQTVQHQPAWLISKTFHTNHSTDFPTWITMYLCLSSCIYVCVWACV